MSSSALVPSAVPAQLDHLVLAGPDLAEAVDRVEQLTGVRAAPGGRHPIGTANALIAFVHEGRRLPWYLEVIGPDPEQGVPASEIETFAIKERTGPGVVTWAVHPADIGAVAHAGRAAGVPYGANAPLSRRTPSGELLEWSLIRLDQSAPDADWHLPFLIDWGATAHPGLGDLPTLELLGLRAEHPSPESLASRLSALGIALEIRRAATPALVATVEGPGGPVELR